MVRSWVFDAEIHIHTKIFPEILLQSDREYIPECCLGIVQNILVLEDMVSEDFRMTKDKFIYLDFDHCMVVIKALGKYHAQSMIFEERNKTSITDFYEKKKIHLEFYLNPDNPLLKVAAKLLLASLDCLSDIDSSSRDKFKIFLSDIALKLSEIISSYSKGRKVQDHGDLWVYPYVTYTFIIKYTRKTFLNHYY